MYVNNIHENNNDKLLVYIITFSLNLYNSPEVY